MMCVRNGTQLLVMQIHNPDLAFALLSPSDGAIKDDTAAGSFPDASSSPDSFCALATFILCFLP